MIEVRRIDALHKTDVNIANEPFSLFGRMIPKFDGKEWTYTLDLYERERVTEMCFPDENYDYDAMKDSIFLGAYDEDRCIGLAILQPGFFKYMYLYDLKVNREYRRRQVGTLLIQEAKKTAKQNGYCGVFLHAQDNNPGACLFYLRSGFRIGGLDTDVYRHTKQEGKADILFYCESD